MEEEREWVVTTGGERLDRVLVSVWPDLSRARAQALLAEGLITVDGEPARPSDKPRAGAVINLNLPEARPAEPVAQDIPLDILHQDDSLLVVQIESPQAIENVDAIAALPGVDALFLGPDDIMLRRGYSMTTPRSRETLGNDMEAVAAACRRHGKIGAMVAVSEEMLRLCLEMGFTLLCGGAEVGFLANGSKQAATQARGIVASHSAEAGLRGHAVAAAR